MSHNTPITELDFFNIKQGFKDYLESQDRFKDYNFEGSNLSVLLDVLAYNSYQNNFFTNMALNEMFLDSAELYGSAVSHAKTLNYTPRSMISARAVVNVILDVSGNPNFITVPAETKFIAKCGNKNYTFYNENAMVVEPSVEGYVAKNLVLYEGVVSREIYNVRLGENEFKINNKNVDTTSIKVFVKESSTDTEEVEYMLQTSIVGNNPDAHNFYVQAMDEEFYSIYFGMDKFGNQPKGGAVIRIEYRVTHGEEANGVINFNLANTISGYTGIVQVVSPSKGGFDKENIESIKYFAPKNIQVQDRAITENDYEILLKNRFPEIEAMSVMGGDEVNPPRYGKVLIAIDVENAEGMSENDRRKYKDYLISRVPVGIEPIIIDPEFMFMNLTVNVYFDINRSTDNEADLKRLVSDTISSYNKNNLNDFRITFRPSRLMSVIDHSHPSIISSDLNAIPIIPINPTLVAGDTYIHHVDFANALVADHEYHQSEEISTHRPAIKSSPFTYGRDTGYIMDNGVGVLNFYKNYQGGAVVVKRDVGTVNYTTGSVYLSNMIVNSYSGSEIKIYGLTESPTIKPPKNRILSIRDEDVIINLIGVNNV